MPVFAPGASLAAASFCRHHRDTEPGEFQSAKFELLVATVCCSDSSSFFQTPRATSRSTAPGIGNAGLRRPSSTRSRPQPVRRRRPGRGLARLAGCGGISRKLPCGFLQGTAFPLGDSRASSIVVGSSTIGNVQKIFVGCVPRSGTSAGWPQRNSVFPVLIVVLASRFAEGLAVVLTA